MLNLLMPLTIFIRELRHLNRVRENPNPNVTSLFNYLQDGTNLFWWW